LDFFVTASNIGNYINHQFWSTEDRLAATITKLSDNLEASLTVLTDFDNNVIFPVNFNLIRINNILQSVGYVTTLLQSAGKNIST